MNNKNRPFPERLTALEIRQMRMYYKDDNSPFAVIALGILDDEEQGVVDPFTKEEIAAMRILTKGDKLAQEILDDAEKELKGKA